MANILVTGGAGFMGSHVVDDLIYAGHDVFVIDDLSGGFEININKKAHFINGSIEDYSLINKLFENYKFEYIYHLAAYAAEGLSHFIRRFNYNNNLIGSVNLINASIIHEVKCFIFTSSIAVYGEGQLPMTELTSPKPEDPYGIAKYAVELDLFSANKMYNLNYIIFRPHNVYGERQNLGDKYRNVVGIFMNQIMQNTNLTIFGDGNQTRAFTHISDVSSIISKSPWTDSAINKIFNIGADEVYTVNELANKVRAAFSSNQNIVYLEQRKEVLHAYSSHERLKEIFDYTAKISLDEGIDRMATWAKRVGIQPSRKFENIEIMKNLPNSWNNN
jgi:UDP-glucose 4-epimerase